VDGPLYVSQRTAHPRYPNVFNRPGIKVVASIDSIKADGHTVVFSDGTTFSDIDTIIFSTGYHHSFPFTSSLNGAKSRDGSVIDGLFHHTFDIENDGIAYVGYVHDHSKT